VNDQRPPWEELEAPGRASVEIGGVTVAAGSRVLLCPRAGRDILDLALTGRTAVVEGVDESLEGEVHLAVVLEDDPGRALGEGRQIGHRFFFAVDEVTPLEDLERDPARPRPPRVLVAGIGNVFLGDDGFGVAVAQRLAQRELPAGVRAVDFGIRGIDLVHALQDDPDVAILVDALPGDQAPGTLTVLEPELARHDPAGIEPHAMDPLSVLHTARRLGAAPGRTLIVGCEPLTRMTGEEPDVVMELSPPVAAAVEDAAALVEALLAELTERTVKE
jgi:hydrogenase maturation protease